MALLLFDIDGTLLHANGAGREAVEQALSALLGQPIHAHGVDFSGKTDPQCIREVLVYNEIAPTDALVAAGLRAYEAAAAPLLTADRVHPLPGVFDVLAALQAEAHHHLALLTGNLEAMAYAKLAALGLADAFPFGAFGSDHEDRNALPTVALARAATHTGRAFAGREVVVIGDTPRDIACARVVGGVAVAVATGKISRDVLEAHQPDVLLEDLTDHRGFLRLLRAL